MLLTHPLFYRKAPTFSSQGFVMSKIFWFSHWDILVTGFSHWDRYLGMRLPITQIPVPATTMSPCVMIYTIDRETPTQGLLKATHEQLDQIRDRVIAAGIPCTASY